MKRITTTLLIACWLVCLPGCSSLESKTQKLKLGMTKEQVIDLLGSDYTVVGARLDKDGSELEALRFGEKRKEEVFTYFKAGKLVQWGDTEILQTIPGAK